MATPEIICVMALTLQPIRGCPQHSGETGTRLSSAIHRRLFSRFFLREGGRLYTGYQLTHLSFIGCIPLSKSEARIKNQTEFFVFDKFTLQNLANKSDDV